MSNENQEALTQEAIIEANSIDVESVEDVIYKVGEYQFKALITRIQIVKAVLVFGDATIKGQEDKLVNRIHFEIIEKQRNKVPQELSNKGITIISKVPASSKRSNMFKFVKRYGEVPRINLEVNIENNESGYWKLIL